MKKTKLAAAVFFSGVSAREIARVANINETTLYLAISGRRKPGLETSLRIARALDTSPEELGLIGLSCVGGNDGAAR